MFSEIFGLLSSVDVSKSKGGRKFTLNLNRNRIRSISAYSSNSIFYFPTIVSDQAMPEEVAMVSRMCEKSYASFVVACISLMPFHRIKADDKASIEEYLQQFHQNMGINPGSGPIMNKLMGFVDSLEESSMAMSEVDAVKELQESILTAWRKSLATNTNFVKVMSESISLNEMFQEDPIDPKIRVLQEQYLKTREELDDWGFIGEATDDMFDDLDDDWDDFEDDDDDFDEDDDSFLDDYLDEATAKKIRTDKFQKNYDKLLKRLNDPGFQMFGTGTFGVLKIAFEADAMIKSATSEDDLKKATQILRTYNFGSMDAAQQKSFDAAIERKRKQLKASMNEAAMKSSKRNALSDDQFGLPEDRKYPLNDAKHVRLAVKMFGHCEEGKRKKLAGNILKAAEKHGVSIKVGKNNPMAEYVPETMVEATASSNNKLKSKIEKSLKSAGLDHAAKVFVDASGKVSVKTYSGDVSDAEIKRIEKICNSFGDVERNDDDDKIYFDFNEAASVKSAIDNIKFSLESVSANKILSCSSLTKLASLESKLKKLKNKYVKYLNRYKKKYKENQKSGSNSKLQIRFNNIQISDPKAFMKQYGSYIKIINKRLKLVEKRREQLRTRKDQVASSKKSTAEAQAKRAEQRVPSTTAKLEENAITDLTEMDFHAIDFCESVIDHDLNAPDSEIFTLIEAVNPKDPDDPYIKKGEKILASARKGYRDMKKERDEANRKAELQGRRAYKAEQREKEANRQRFEASKQLEQERDRNQKLQSQLDAQKYGMKDNDPDAVTVDADGNEIDVVYDRGRSRNNINAARAARNGQTNFKTFDREVFTNMDMTKANEAVPLFTKATIGFIVDETEEVVSRDVLIGIKAYIHRAPSLELVNDIYNSIINKRKFLRFVKFITGEERSLSDLVFGIKELRNDALDARGGAGEWRSAFKRRRRWSKMSITYLMKDYTQNGTIVMTMNEVEYIRSQYGIDIMKPDHVKMIMDSDFLLGFVILDQAEEMVYVTYDGHGYGFQTYTYAMLQRESQNTTSRELRELYRAISR